MTVRGCFESIVSHRELGWLVKGWAFDDEAPDLPVRLVLACEDGPIGTFLADGGACDPAAEDAAGSRHAFTLKLPERLFDGSPHVLEILAEKDGRSLPRKTSGLFFPPRLHGCLNKVENGTLVGWAFDRYALNSRIALAVEIDGAPIETVSAAFFCPELAKTLNSQGLHGFRYALPAGLFDGRPHRIAVRFANMDQHLAGSPTDVVLDPSTLTARRKALDTASASHAARLEDVRTALSFEPLNRLGDPLAYREWLVGHEAAISARVTRAGGVVPQRRIAVLAVPSGKGSATALAAVLAAEKEAEALVLLPSGAHLHPGSLPLVHEALAEGVVDVVYTDEDERAEDGGRRRPHFKPSWDPDRYLAFPYVGAACAIVRHHLDAAIRLAGPPEDAVDGDAWAAAVLDAALLSAGSERVRHLPFVLYHGAGQAERALRALGRSVRIQSHLDRMGVDASVRPDGGERVRIRWNLPAEPPRVSLLVPTRDRKDLLEACIDSVLTTTRYPSYDVVVIDNDSRDPETLAYLERIARRNNVWVRRWPRPFNYAAMHNAVIAEVSAPYVALLNNDVEVIEAGWLEEMMGLAVRPDVSAVGAKLLYPDGTIQHGGVLVGQFGLADHAQRAFAHDEEGYFHSGVIVQNVTAVTAACMVCRCADYRQVGGMDAENLTIAFNDVDLCLKLRARGRRVLWTPHAVLRHHESASRKANRLNRPSEREVQEMEYLRRKWNTDTFSDPFYSPNLTRHFQTHVDFNWSPSY